MRLKCALLAFLCMHLDACKTATNSGNRFASVQAPLATQLTLNDVSITLPILDKTEFLNKAMWAWDTPNPAKFAAGQPAAPMDGEAFLPAWALAALDQQVLRDDNLQAKEKYKFEAKTVAPVKEQDQFGLQQDFTAISFRFDPCANVLTTLGDDGKCQQQMHILWQPINNSDQLANGLHVIDDSVLGIYTMTRAEFAASVSTLLGMQQDSGLNYKNEPLQAHPVLKVQGPSGSYFAGLQGLIHRYARGSRLTMIYGFANVDPGANDSGNWIFAASKLNARTAVVPTPLAAVILGKKETPKTTQRLLGEDGVINTVVPVSAISDTPQHLYDSTHYDVTNVDCSSCHQAYLRDQASGSPAGIDPSAPLAKKFNLTSAGTVTNATGLVGTPLQMFSYNAKDGTLVISPRTAFESAAAADYINRVYLNANQ